MTYKAKIKKVLVVLSPDLIRPDKPKQSSLVQRAVALAKITGCELELFHVCHDGSLEHQIFASDDDLERQREELTDRDATLLAEMVTRLRNEGVNVHHEVRWDTPRSDAILRKVAQWRPDIVMKQSREHSFILGITSNTDWDLVRRSPAHVWLVNDKVDDIDRIVAAVGNKLGDPGDITTAADYELLRTAGLIGDTFKAAIYPVNAYQLPELQNLVAGVEGAVVAVASAEEKERARAQMVKQHSGAVKALAQYFNIARHDVHIREGHPNKVIPEVVESTGADMIVMGANNISRLERLVSSVTVEPVMAETDADILVVRDRVFAGLPNTAESPFYGVPKYDLEHAITHPEATFDSPQMVANLPEISVELRKRILQAWEYDIRAEMAEENEGGPTKDIDINALDEIFSAKALLDIQQQKSGNVQMALHGTGGG